MEIIVKSTKLIDSKEKEEGEASEEEKTNKGCFD